MLELLGNTTGRLQFARNDKRGSGRNAGRPTWDGRGLRHNR